MKAIILFSVLIASAVAKWHPGNEENWAQYGEDQPRRSARPDLDADTLHFLMRQRLHTQQGDAFETNTDSQASPMGNWAAYPEAAAFEAKIQGRLETSRILSNKSAIRQKLMEIANEKFNQCKGKVDNLERACLGRATGQVMQLVAAVENMSRNQQ